MNQQYTVLKRRVHEVCRQWKKLILLKGGAQVLISTIVAFMLAFLLDSLFDLDTVVRLGLLAVIVAAFLVTLYIEIIRPFLNVPTEIRIARYLEEKHPHLEDRLVTAIELGDSENLQVSHNILEKLLDDARFHVEPLNLPQTLQARGAVVWSSVALVAMLFLTGMIFSNMDQFGFRINRLFTPWKFPTIKPKPALVVTPGNVRVPRGSAQEINTELTGFEAEQITLYYASDDSSWHKVDMDRTEAENIFVYHFFDLEVDTRYYVKADEKLSDIYRFTLYDAPEITRVDLAYKFPEYTGLEPKWERDTGDVWAPVGTVVTIRALADKALHSAKITLAAGAKLKTRISSDSVITATLTVKEDTYYTISITDTDRLPNDPAPEYYIHALPDDPPTLTMERPGRDIKATMLEEVSVHVLVQDDYGLPDVKLKYVINGSLEKEISLKLQEKSTAGASAYGADPVKEFASAYLFYLEELNVQPGDFLSYYAEAFDPSSNDGEVVTSDIFFVEVRPFEAEFTRPLSQGQMGGGNGMGAQLSHTQKEILVATWKTRQKARKVESDELAGDIQVLVESQENLLEVTQGTLFQIQQRSVFTRDSGKDLAKFYSAAVGAMQRAVDELKKPQLTEAQTPQREALRSLLQAEAQIKEIQIQQAQGQGQGYNATLDELSELFEQETDKLNNKYETLRDQPQQQKDRGINDALEKVKELAKRQQQFNRRMRDLARENLNRQEKKRRIEELRREQEDIRRETQELARQMQQSQQQNSGLPRQVQEDLRRASSEMNNAAHNLGKDNAELAAAKGTRALKNLNRLEDMLRRSQKESLRRQVDELEQQFQQLADGQKRLTQQVRDLAQNKNPREEGIESAVQKQQSLADGLSRAERQLQSLSRQAQSSKNQSAREIRELAQELGHSELKEKMESAQKLLQEKKLNSALQAEKDILATLERTGEQLTKLRGALAESEDEKLDLALNQTRRLRKSLEELQRHAEQLSRAEKRQEREAQTARGQGGKIPQSGPGESKSTQEKLNPEQIDWMNEELARGLNDLEFIQQSLQSDTTLSQAMQQLKKNLNGVLRTFTSGVTERMQLIEEQVLIPLKGLEAELAQKLDLLKSKEKLFLAREEQIPAGYEELVQKYYEALSKAVNKE